MFLYFSSYVFVPTMGWIVTPKTLCLYHNSENLWIWPHLEKTKAKTKNKQKNFFTDVIKLKISRDNHLTLFKEAVNWMTGIFIRDTGKRNTEKKRLCENRGRDWSVVTSHECLQPPWLAETRKDLPSDSSERIWLCHHIDARVLVSVTVRE